MKNANTAATVWGQLKRKLAGPASGDGGTPNSINTKGSRADANASGDGGATPTKTTTKKPRARKPKAELATEEDGTFNPFMEEEKSIIKTEGANGEGIDTAPAPKATPKKRAPKAKAATNGDATDADGSPPKKRARKPKDPNATPVKRVKKSVATDVTEPEAPEIAGFVPGHADNDSIDDLPHDSTNCGNGIATSHNGALPKEGLNAEDEALFSQYLHSPVAPNGGAN